MTSIHQHHDTIQEAILAAFRDTGHRVTSQRLNLLNVLREEGGFLDAEEIYRRAAPDVLEAPGAGGADDDDSVGDIRHAPTHIIGFRQCPVSRVSAGRRDQAPREQ